MRPNKQQVLLLSALLLLALPVVHAKKSDSDNGYRDESSQGNQIRGNARDKGRDADVGTTQAERRGNGRDKRNSDERQRDEPPPRYEQPSQRYEPRYPDQRDYEPRPQTRSQSRGGNMSDAVSEAERRTGGRVLSADPREENGELYYRVKVLTPNGRVQILYIDAR